MPKTNFVDGDPSQGILGTIVPADYLNTLNNHHHTGLDQDGHGALPYAAATGTNDLILTLNPPLTQYVVGMPIYLKTVDTNTGSMTLSVDGLESKSIFKNTSEALTAGEVPSGAVIAVVYDGTAFQLQSTPVKLNADTVDTKHAADLLDRANHTGTQSIATLSDHDKAAHDALGIAASTAATASDSELFSGRGYSHTGISVSSLTYGGTASGEVDLDTAFPTFISVGVTSIPTYTSSQNVAWRLTMRDHYGIEYNYQGYTGTTATYPAWPTLSAGNGKYGVSIRNNNTSGSSSFLVYVDWLV